MRHGEWHDASFDASLLAERQASESPCFDFNTSRPGRAEQRSALRKLLGIDAPEGFTVLAPVYFDYGAGTHFGEGDFVNHGRYFMGGGEIFIGKDVFIGPFCGFYTASHPMKFSDRNRGLESALPIRIGDDCWFGANASVLQGVTIGSGCVIAAGSVVTKDLPDNCLAVGVPASVKRYNEQ